MTLHRPSLEHRHPAASFLLITTSLLLVILVLLRIMKKFQPPLNPVVGPISSPFGPRTAPTPGASSFHNGVDIALPVGTTVHAPWDSTVLRAWNDTAYGGGLSLRLSHPNGYITAYCHLSRILVDEGQTLSQGDPIAETGTTGRTTGPHLHFSLRDSDNNKIDPQKFFDFKVWPAV